MAGFRSALFILGISSPAVVPPAPSVATDGYVLVKNTAIAKGAEWRHALPCLVPLNMGSNAFVSPVSVAEYRDINTYYRAALVLTGAKAARLIVNAKTVVSGHSGAVQYSTDSGGTWDYLDGGTGPSVAPAVGLNVGTWITLDPLATGDVWLRLVTSGGDGVTSANWYNIYVEFSYVEG